MGMLAVVSLWGFGFGFGFLGLLFGFVFLFFLLAGERDDDEKFQRSVSAHEDTLGFGRREW